MEIFDLTMPIDERTPVIPGDLRQEIKQVATVSQDGYSKKRFSFDSHFSTHIDAPYHMLENGKKLTDYPIETFVGDAVVIDVCGQAMIDDPLDQVRPRDIVFFFTGHSDKAYQKDYFETSPVLSPAVAQKLIDKKVKIVGIDSWSPDRAPYEIHKMLFPAEIMILENVINLAPLNGKRFQCFIAPLKIQDGDGAPCRVIGVIE